jgi:CheY-like chemotaxis protein
LAKEKDWKKILVVDDEPDITYTLKATLDASGFFDILYDLSKHFCFTSNTEQSEKYRFIIKHDIRKHKEIENYWYYSNII